MGWVKIEVVGANLHRFLNTLNTFGIKTKRIEKLNNQKLRLFVPYKNLQYLFANFNKSCYTISILQNPLFLRCYNQILGHFGVAIGMFVCCILLIVFNQFCWGVKVFTEDEAVTESVQQYLIQAGIYGQSKSNIDCNNLEVTLCNHFEQLSLVNVSFYGCFLIVNTTLATLPSEVQKNVEGEIIATLDGVITRIHLISGTSLVRVGDVVTKGQPLIANYFIDRNEEKVECEAKGIVYASKWYSATVDFAINSVEYARTGNVVSVSTLNTFGQEIALGNANIELPTTYDLVTVTKYLVNSSALPIKVTIKYYYETTGIEVTRNFEDEKEALIYEAKELTLAQCNENEVLDEKFTIALVGDIYFVTYYMSIDRQIT